MVQLICTLWLFFLKSRDVYQCIRLKKIVYTLHLVIIIWNYNYSSKAKWILFNNPLDVVLGIIISTIFNEHWSSVTAWVINCNCIFFHFICCFLEKHREIMWPPFWKLVLLCYNHLMQGDYSKIWHNSGQIRLCASLLSPEQLY